MAKFHFYRIEVHQSQSDLYVKWPGSSRILHAAIHNLPTALADKRQVHFTAQFQDIDERSCFFQLVRKRKELTEDMEGEFFILRDYPDFPHARVFVDTEFGILAIQNTPKYSKDYAVVTRRLSRWLENNTQTFSLKYKVVISPIRNPVSLIAELNNAKIVRKLFFDVKRPNPIDSSAFTEPLKKLTKELNGSKSKTEVIGTNLEKEGMADIIRAVASSGDDVGIEIIPAGGKQFVRKSLKRNNVVAELNDEENTLSKIMEWVRITYKNVRG